MQAAFGRFDTYIIRSRFAREVRGVYNERKRKKFFEKFELICLPQSYEK